MTSKRTGAPKRARRRSVPAEPDPPAGSSDLVIITGLSGSGKGTVLRSFEDLGYYAVDNLPVDLIPKFAQLARESPSIRRAALVVDIREGSKLKNFPAMFRGLKKQYQAVLVFLEADDNTLMRRFSETRRPHPLGGERTVLRSIKAERTQLEPIRALADHILDTSKFNVHELRELIGEKFHGGRDESNLMVSVTSFGFRHGVPADSDLVFDVRFLPNPNYIPQFKKLSGRHPQVARYIRSFPQTVEFLERISDLLIYLLPHYLQEGKSYLTISFGCTGGHHRSVMMAHEIRRRLEKAGYKVKESHRDLIKGP